MKQNSISQLLNESEYKKLSLSLVNHSPDNFRNLVICDICTERAVSPPILQVQWLGRIARASLL